MSKKPKVKNLDKETKQCIETISDLFRNKNGEMKLRKGKKGKTKKILRNMCFHWIIRKDQCLPLVDNDPEDPNYWLCRCGAKFRKAPATEEERERIIDEFLSLVNSTQFYSVNMGGDKDDSALFIKLKKLIPDFRRVAKEVSKAIQKRADYEDNKAKSEELDKFGSSFYNDFSYR